MRHALAVVMFAGCGRIGFEPHDAGAPLDDDASLADAPPDIGDAATLGPFNTPVLVTELFATGLETTNPTLTDDELEIFMIRRLAGSGDVFVSRRASKAGSWSAPVQVGELNSGDDEAGLHLSRDGLTIWFSSLRSGGLGGHDIYAATRPTRASPFSTPVNVAGASTPADDSNAVVDGTQLNLVISVAPAPRELYTSQRANLGAAFAPLQVITSLASPSDDAAPELSPDGLSLYFISDRPGGQGDADFYVATRASTTAPFGAPIALTELNGPARESTVWISPDAHVMYFSSNRSGTIAIYRASR